MESMNELLVISLGGSVIVPQSIDTEFLTRFKQSLLALIAEGHVAVLIPGGGVTARAYQQALLSLGVNDLQARDRVGIQAIRINAELLHAFFIDVAYPEILMDNHNLPSDLFKLLIAAGGVPGRSSDAGAVELAKASGGKTIINLSNVAKVFSADPHKNQGVQAFHDISWDAYRKIIPMHWDPGLSTPFDPIASAMAQMAGLTVAILDGHDTSAFEHFVRTGQCAGTLIHP